MGAEFEVIPADAPGPDVIVNRVGRLAGVGLELAWEWSPPNSRQREIGEMQILAKIERPSQGQELKHGFKNQRAKGTV